MQDKKGFLDRFAEISARVGNQVHLRSLRDGFATIMPLFILAGIGALFNNVVFTWIWGPGSFAENATMLSNAQHWGAALSNGTLNISAILLAGVVAYALAVNKRFQNPLSCSVISMSALAIFMPQTVEATLANTSSLFVADKVTTAEVTGAFTTGFIGTSALFGAIIIALITTSAFISCSQVDKLKIHLGEGVPPAVEKSFNVLLPMLIVLGLAGVLASFLYIAAQTDLTSLINTFIQTPLRALTTNIWGLIFIYSIGNLLFTLGIHQSTINGVLVEPILTIVLLENTAFFNAGQPIPVENYMNMDIINMFGLMGGSGCTLALLIATFLLGKYKPSKEVAKMSIFPGLFNINEPVIYGYPIVFNLPMMIPFILCPIIGIVSSYFATLLGIISPCVIQAPWTTPVGLSGFLATGGDIRAAIFQIVLLAAFVLIYIPFMKVSERSMQLQSQQGAPE